MTPAADPCGEGERGGGGPAPIAIRRSRPPSLALHLQSEPQHASRILEFLYVGGESASCDRQGLRDMGIVTVVNATKSIPSFFMDDAELKTVRVPLEDEPGEPLLLYLEPAMEAIEEARRCGGAALIYCKRGMSRSPAIVLAYLLKHCNMSLLEAFQLARSLRPQISPNPGYMAQLSALETELFHGQVTLDAGKYALDRYALPQSLSPVQAR